MRSKKQSDGFSSKSAQRFAKSGAELGAAAGGRVGPVTTGLASGFGGAVGYLAGAAVDGMQTSIEQGTPATDGGTPETAMTDRADDATEIPVTEESH